MPLPDLSPRDVTLLLHASAALVAMALALHSRHHRPFAAWLCATAIGDVLLVALSRAWPTLQRPAGGAPLEGAERVAFIGSTSLTLLWPLSFLALAFWTCLRRRGLGVGIAGAAWVALSAVVAARYPDLRGEALRHYYFDIDLVALGMSAGVGISRWLNSDEHTGWTTSHLGLTFVLTIEFILAVAGPYKLGLYGAAWTMAQIGYSVLYTALITVQGVTLWSLYRR